MSEPSVRLNEILGDLYHVKRELGQGGMATANLQHPHILPLFDAAGGQPGVMARSRRAATGEPTPLPEQGVILRYDGAKRPRIDRFR